MEEKVIKKQTKFSELENIKIRCKQKENRADWGYFPVLFKFLKIRTDKSWRRRDPNKCNKINEVVTNLITQTVLRRNAISQNKSTHL